MRFALSSLLKNEIFLIFNKINQKQMYFCIINFKNKIKMKRFSILLVLIGIVSGVHAQIAPNKYWVQFTDKNDSPYSINRPEEFLSERSIQRRQFYGIAIDEYDIPVNPSYLQAVAEIGADILNPSKWLNGVTVMTTDPAIIAAIENLPFVASVRGCSDEPFKQMIKEKMYFDHEFYQPLNENNNYREFYGSAYPQINQLNGIALHDSGYQGQDMLIGICDGGFDGADTHEVFDSIRAGGRLLGTRDFVDHSTVYVRSGHGTSVWSLMGGYIPNVYVGTAPLASYFLCRTEDTNSENVIEEYNWVSGAEFLDSLGVDVINSSLGYVIFDDPQWNHVYEDMDGNTCVITTGAEIACSRGILCVNSAGNDGDNNDYPYIGAPADGEHVLTVGAVGTDGHRAFFSSIGPTCDGRIKPDVMAHGYGTTVANPRGGYYEGSGTSFSSPVMAGMVACLWQAHREKTADEIRESLRQNANYTSNPNNEYGYGIPDFMAALDYLDVEDNVIADNHSLISVFPNPSNGNVNVNLSSEESITVQVFDQLGRMLYYTDLQQNNTYKIDEFLSNLNKGLYLIEAVGLENYQTVKFIKY